MVISTDLARVISVHMVFDGDVTKGCYRELKLAMIIEQEILLTLCLTRDPDMPHAQGRLRG